MPPPTKQAAPVANPGPSLGLGDIYYAIFRHKWKILACASLGIALGLGAYKVIRPSFQSQAKLFVRYVLAESRNLGPGLNATAKSPDRGGETIMTSEMELLTSFNLAKSVAETLGPDKILAGSKGPVDANSAAVAILNGLSVSVTPKSSIIHVAFSHKDPQTAQPVLQELLDLYLKRHTEVHRSKASGGDFLISETDQYRSRLIQTEEELRKIRNRAGIMSVEDSKKALGEQLASVRQQLLIAEAELAQRAALFEALAKEHQQSPAPAAPVIAQDAPPRDAVEEYKSLASRAAAYQRLEQELLLQFTAENARVKEVRAQLAEVEAAKRNLEIEYPSATRASDMPVATASPPLPRFDSAPTAAELHSLRARIKTLEGQMETLKAEALRVDAVDSEISQLKRKKELDEVNYRMFAASLEQSRIAEAFGDGEISNITQIQTPSPAAPNFKKKRMALFSLLAGGLVLGLGWAFAIEFYFDRTVRRPIDVERRIPFPLFLSIPIAGFEKKRKKGLRASTEIALNTANPVQGHLRVFHETLRDRLISFADSRGLTHKPKLIALTGLHVGAGVTTTAAGLARSLSETGDGNVLLVDMTGTQGSAQQFMAGKAVCGLDEMLDTRSNAHVQENLYVVAENNYSEALSRNIPQRFSKLLPKLKASDFDYIIFDMPPVSQISITLRLAAFMDISLLVLESEKTNQETAQRAAALLAQSRSHVGVVLNKTRSYLPTGMEQELVGL